MVRAISVLLLFASFETKSCITEKVNYVSLERPVWTYINNKYVSYANVSARRYSRRSWLYFVDSYVQTIQILNNSAKWDIYFYEFWGNSYRQALLELHYGTCDLITKDMLFGSAVRRFIKNCPIPPGIINIVNATVTFDHFPSLPFTKGRIFANCTLTKPKETIIAGHIDMEVKQYAVKKNVKTR